MLKNLGQCDQHKLSLVNRRITLIDKVAGRFHGIQTLFLSNNYIKELGQISQFSSLRTLSLSHNNIESVKELIVKLADCETLENLRVDGNPAMEYTPLAFARLVVGLPQLKFLDGTAITQQLRKDFHDILQKEDATLDTLVQNTQAIESLGLATSADESFEFFRDQERPLSQFEKDRLKESISSHLAAKAKKGITIKEWEAALSHALIESTQQLANKKMEMQGLSARSNRSEPRPRGGRLQQHATMSPQRRGSLDDHQSMTPLRRSAGKIRGKKRVQWSDQVVADSVELPPPQPEQFKGVRLEFQDLEEVPRMTLKERNVNSTSAKRAPPCHSDKDLQLKLRAHKIEELETQYKRQTDLNKRISSRLQHFQKQNIENVKVAEEKISTLSQRIHEQSIAKSDLEGRLIDAEKLIQLLSEENARLNKDCGTQQIRLSESATIVEQFQFMMEQPEQSKKAERMHCKALQKRFLALMRRGIKQEGIVQKYSRERVKKLAKIEREKYFRKWRIAFRRQMFRRESIAKQMGDLALRGLVGLKKNIVIERFARDSVKRREKEGLVHAISEWQSYVDLCKRIRKGQRVAEFHRSYVVKKRIAQSWRRFVIMESLSPKELRKLQQKADAFRANKLRQRAYIKLKVGNLALKHQRLQHELAYTFYGKRVCKTALWGWKQEMLERRQARLVAEMSRAKLEKHKMKLVFYVLWDYSQRLATRIRLNRQKERFVWLKFFRRWKCLFEISFALHEKEIQLAANTAVSLLTRTLRGWAQWKQRAKTLRWKQERVQSLRLQRTRKKLLRNWIKGGRWMRGAQSYQEKRQEREKQRVLRIWVEAARARLVRKLRLKKAMYLGDRQLSCAKKLAIKHWFKLLQRGRTEEDVVLAFQDRWRAQRLRCFWAWRGLFASRVQGRLSREQKERTGEQSEARVVAMEKQNLEERMERITAELDTTAVQFQELSLSATNQELLIKAQASKIQELEHALKLQKAENEAMKSKVDFAQIRENDIDLLLSKQRRGYESTVKKMKKELLTLQARNEDLQFQLKVAKESKLESEQKVLQSVTQDEQKMVSFQKKLQHQEESLKSLEVALLSKNHEVRHRSPTHQMKDITRRYEGMRVENRSLKEELSLVANLEKQAEKAISHTVDELNVHVDRQNLEKRRLHDELLVAHAQIQRLQSELKIGRVAPDYHHSRRAALKENQRSFDL